MSSAPIVKLVDFTEEVNKEAEDIIVMTEKMVETGEKLHGISQGTEEKLKDTNNITDIIKGISSKTKILGINASIEAARVGEKGRGFDVVAKEVQELASKSSESITKIENTLEQFYEIVQKLNKVSNDISNMSDKQAEIINEIYARLENLSAIGNEVVEVADSLSSN